MKKKKLTKLIVYHVIIFINLVLISYNLNLIGPAKILAWATNYWQQLPDVPFTPTERLAISESSPSSLRKGGDHSSNSI